MSIVLVCRRSLNRFSLSLISVCKQGLFKYALICLNELQVEKWTANMQCVNDSLLGQNIG